MPLVSLVVARADNGTIGRDHGLPWRLPEDLRRFKAVTLGKPILMGRKTFESIGHALPGRRNLVLTRDPGWAATGAVPVHSVQEALAQATGAAELMVIGGAEVYRQVLPFAGRIHLTQVHAEVPGDTFLPAFDAAQWLQVAAEAFPADERNSYPVTFVTLERRAIPPPHAH